uniref:Uncharacterized protein n=1 Tax=Arundo donax TaxID=35708 RepID=A0A0A9GZG3_ARUDO
MIEFTLYTKISAAKSPPSTFPIYIYIVIVYVCVCMNIYVYV